MKHQQESSTKLKDHNLRVVVLYSAGHLGSAMILNKLIQSDLFEVVGVVKAKPLNFSSAGLKKLRQHLKKIGWRFGWLLFWQRLIQASVFVLNLLIKYSNKSLLPAWRIAKKYHIPLYYADNVNEATCNQFIENLKPEIIISAYFPHFLKKDIITIPKHGILNVHPGWLPAYKGAMAYFWVLTKNEDSAGVTIHWIDEGIDTGAIVARQKIKLNAGTTQQNVLEATARVGFELLEQIGNNLILDINPKTIKPYHYEQDEYYPMPGEREFNNYFQHRRYFRIRDVFKVIRGHGE